MAAAATATMKSTAMTVPFDVIGLGETMLSLIATDGPLEQATTFFATHGGAETNTLVGLSRLGARTAWVSRLGDDVLGRRIERDLRDEGIDLRWVRRDPDRATGVMIRDTDGGLVYRRDHSAASALSPDDLQDVTAARGAGCAGHRCHCPDRGRSSTQRRGDARWRLWDALRRPEPASQACGDRIARVSSSCPWWNDVTRCWAARPSWRRSSANPTDPTGYTPSPSAAERSDLPRSSSSGGPPERPYSTRTITGPNTQSRQCKSSIPWAQAMRSTRLTCTLAWPVLASARRCPRERGRARRRPLRSGIPLHRHRPDVDEGGRMRLAIRRRSPPRRSHGPNRRSRGAPSIGP